MARSLSGTLLGMRRLPERLERGHGFAGGDGGARLRETIGDVGGVTGDGERSGGVEGHKVGERAGLAFEDAMQGFSVLCGRAAEQGLRVEDGDAEILGTYLEGFDFVVPEFGDQSWTGGGDLVHPVAAVHDPGALGAQAA